MSDKVLNTKETYQDSETSHVDKIKINIKKMA